MALFVLVSLASSVTVYLLYQKESQKNVSKSPQQSTPQTSTPQPTPVQINIPLPDAKSRVTKKHFGQYITPATSPVQPEKFTGFHTGTDFEIKPEELNAKVTVYAICDGPVEVNQFVSGYGGVVVQSCAIEGAPAQVLYGHISLSQSTNAGTLLKKGDPITVLGAAYSTETDGERKHLHLGIIRGTTIDYRGYVPSQPELSKWINPESYLGF